MSNISSRELAKGLSSATDAIRKLGLAFSTAGFLIASKWDTFGERLYRIQKGRIPGSDRTSRLRKKRRKAIACLLEQGE